MKQVRDGRGEGWVDRILRSWRTYLQNRLNVYLIENSDYLFSRFGILQGMLYRANEAPTNSIVHLTRISNLREGNKLIIEEWTCTLFLAK